MFYFSDACPSIFLGVHSVAEKQILDRQSLFARKETASRVHCSLPGGGQVLMKVPRAGDWRAYQASLRNKDGNYIDTRIERGDEILISTLLINPDGSQMFTLDDVMAGCFDNEHILAADINVMSDKAYELYGRRGFVNLTDEDRQKNLSETVPNG
jgi:hypothetical protein